MVPRGPAFEGYSEPLSPRRQPLYPSLKEHTTLTAGQTDELSTFQLWLHLSPRVLHAPASWDGPDPLPATPSVRGPRGSHDDSGSGREQSPGLLPPYTLLLQVPQHAASRHIPIHLLPRWLEASYLLPGGVQ